MKKIQLFSGMIRQEIFRLLLDWRMGACIVLYVVICIAAIHQERGAISCVSSAMEYIIGLSNMNKLLVLTAALPFSCSFYEDWTNSYIRPAVLRCGTGAYVAAKVVVCIASAFLVSMIGLVSFSLIELCSVPLDDGYVFDDMQYYTVLHGSIPYMYVIIKASLFSIVASVYAVLGFAISAVMPNLFVAAFSPLLMDFVMEQLTWNNVPRYMKLYAMQNSTAFRAFGDMQNFLLTFCVAAGYMIIGGFIFAQVVRRRINNEIVS